MRYFCDRVYVLNTVIHSVLNWNMKALWLTIINERDGFP